MCRERFLCKCIELAGARIALNGGIESIGVEGLEPRAKSGQLARS